MNIFFTNRLLLGLVVVVLLGVIGALGAYINLTWAQAQYAASDLATINVQGTGEVVAVPNVGTFQYAVISEASTADAAQQAAADTNNVILAYLHETAGVADEDVRTTQYNLQPRYEYGRGGACEPGGVCPPNERVLVGYEVRQTNEVKVRDTDQSGALVRGVGERGASNITSLRFTIDDDAAYVAAARAAAIADAKETAAVLAADLGVRLVRIVSYGEAGVRPQPYQLRSSDMMLESAIAPDIPVGENIITQTVTITYEIR